ncbi:hypothetical protein KIN20_000327 [Parelaphostrongylus tenuis]|uniref:Uncharacterized protein n=1 Tax=Parelaphostrongylus tenuis TaxID=148309 RepID=A0AAD5QFY3_PARTN|nr:hypothetical protein KIN20_000327 [Parelaphostrongylus tenuis]
MHIVEDILVNELFIRVPRNSDSRTGTTISSRHPTYSELVDLQDLKPVQYVRDGHAAQNEWTKQSYYVTKKILLCALCKWFTKRH